jgi:uncharacterized integral membrane protein
MYEPTEIFSNGRRKIVFVGKTFNILIIKNIAIIIIHIFAIINVNNRTSLLHVWNI